MKKNNNKKYKKNSRKIPLFSIFPAPALPLHLLVLLPFFLLLLLLISPAAAPTLPPAFPPVPSFFTSTTT
jgi:hypothetical protein